MGQHRVVTEVWDLLLHSPENLEESYQAQQTIGRSEEAARGHILCKILSAPGGGVFVRHVLSREDMLNLLGLLAGPF